VAITGTTDPRDDVRLGRLRAWFADGVPLRAVVAYEATRLPAGIQERFYRIAPGL
jgi:hypothetical protein